MKHTHKLAAAIITPALFLLLGLALLTTPVAPHTGGVD